jgi:hypothetical protein
MDGKPLCILVVGMAGSGKTTFVKRLQSELADAGKQVFCVNLDPAVRRVSFPAHIDICDSVNYKALMKQYSLGPNGGILTALNLWATKIDQFIQILESKEGLDYILIDTPGQMEVFSWSASGTIIADALASSFPTALVYIADSVRCQDPNIFMSNMLYACSVYYKFKLPLLIAFNKADAKPVEALLGWMQDYELFQTALDTVAQETYLTTLNRSLSLVLDEFYRCLQAVGIASVSGAGFDVLAQRLGACREEYLREYLPELKRKQAEMKAKQTDSELQRFEADHQEDISPITNLIAQLQLARSEQPPRP